MSVNELRPLLGDLQVLVAFARTGSVTAAGDALGIPQPTASRALARLAGRVGAPMTERAGRRLVLTEPGQQLAAAAAEGLGLLADGIAAARRASAPEGAQLVVAYQTVLGEIYLPRAIVRFRTRHPQARFDLRHGARATCLDLVRDQQAQIAVVADPPVEDGLRSTTLFAEPLVAVVPPRHPLVALGRAVTPAEILEHDLVLLGSGFGVHDSVRRILGGGSIPPHAFEVDDYRVARGLAAAGAGVTILPPSAPGLDDVVELSIEHPDARRTIGVVTGTDPHPATPDLIDALRAVARSRWPLTT